MNFLIGSAAALLLAAISGLHFFWAIGGKWGLNAAVPEFEGKPVFQPSPLGTFVVGFLLLIAALIMLGRIGLFVTAEPAFLFDWGTWALAAVFLLRAVGDFRYVGLFKRVRNTEFSYWDSRLHTPISVFLAAAFALMAFPTEIQM